MSHKDPSKTDTMKAAHQDLEETKGSVRDAWISWDYHQGYELRDAAARRLSIATMMQAAFTAGWESGGGDERLEVIEKLNAMIGECCAGDVGWPNCEAYGCGTLQGLITELGSVPDYGEVEG